MKQNFHSEFLYIEVWFSDQINLENYLFQKTMGKRFDSKCGQNPIDTTKKLAEGTLKTVSKKAIQKTVEAKGNLIGIKFQRN